MATATQRSLFHNVRRSVSRRRKRHLSSTVVTHSLRRHQLSHSCLLRSSIGSSSCSCHALPHQHPSLPRWQRQFLLLQELHGVRIVCVLDTASQRLIVPISVRVNLFRPQQRLKVIHLVRSAIERQFARRRRTSLASRRLAACTDTRRVRSSRSWRAWCGRTGAAIDHVAVETKASKGRYRRWSSWRRKCFHRSRCQQGTGNLRRIQIVRHDTARTTGHRRRVRRCDTRECRQTRNRRTLGTAANRVATNLFLVDQLSRRSFTCHLVQRAVTFRRSFINQHRSLTVHEGSCFAETTSGQCLPSSGEQCAIRLMDSRSSRLRRLLCLPLSVDL